MIFNAFRPGLRATTRSLPAQRLVVQRYGSSRHLRAGKQFSVTQLPENPSFPHVARLILEICALSLAVWAGVTVGGRGVMSYLDGERVEFLHPSSLSSSGETLV